MDNSISGGKKGYVISHPQVLLAAQPRSFKFWSQILSKMKRQQALALLPHYRRLWFRSSWSSRGWWCGYCGCRITNRGVGHRSRFFSWPPFSQLPPRRLFTGWSWCFSRRFNLPTTNEVELCDVVLGCPRKLGSMVIGSMGCFTYCTYKWGIPWGERSPTSTDHH